MWAFNATMVLPYAATFPAADAYKMRTKVIQAFLQHNLRVTVDTNLTQTDFLDVTLNLSYKKHWPFGKLNDQPLNLTMQSNYPQWLPSRFLL